MLMLVSLVAAALVGAAVMACGVVLGLAIAKSTERKDGGRTVELDANEEAVKAALCRAFSDDSETGLAEQEAGRVRAAVGSVERARYL